MPAPIMAIVTFWGVGSAMYCGGSVDK
jgi:hypothetical protein